ncbi:hypothetical protein RQP54_18090 [Curvibacter sp. APW13]|uniref:hypothetical protein n=1 Tax=Curvibacter sp. APW13 TaxID=3077236 RepID=UPI0028DDBAA2|nr:hypothetical protein [Curvibacter sp. APW13]MDT8992789.1 hypothetical protein [Curvibacter sp. APW13]
MASILSQSKMQTPIKPTGAVLAYLELVKSAQSAVANGVDCSYVGIAEANGQPHNEVAFFSGVTEGTAHTYKLTEEGIAKGRWQGDMFCCPDHEGNDTRITLFQKVAIVPTRCKKCASLLDHLGLCRDETCPYSDWPQIVDRADLERMFTHELQAKYGIAKRTIHSADDDLQPHLQTVRERLIGAATHHEGPLVRTIRVYSQDEEEQAAYVKMCEATFLIGEALLAQPRGTFLSNDQGGYWLSDAAGQLELYMEWGTDPALDACNVHTATYCEAIGASDMLEIAACIEQSLAAPVFKHESEPGLLDALVLRDFGGQTR